MHALNNVVGEKLFTEEDFKEVSEGENGWWSNFNIMDVATSRQTRIFYVPGGRTKFTEHEFRKMLAMHYDLQHAELWDS